MGRDISTYTGWVNMDEPVERWCKSGQRDGQKPQGSQVTKAKERLCFKKKA